MEKCNLNAPNSLTQVANELRVDKHVRQATKVKGAVASSPYHGIVCVSGDSARVCNLASHFNR